MHFTYILFSSTLDKLYKGQTDDLKARIEKHNSGTVPYTKAGTPWILLWSSEKNSRSEAVKLETKLKNLGTRKTLNFMLKYQDGIAGNEALNIIKKLSEKFIT